MRGKTHSQSKSVPEPWVASLAGFDHWLTAADKSPRTRELRQYQLGRLARAFPDGPASVTSAGIVDWLASHQWAAETRRGTNACLRAFFEWATRHGVVSSDPTDGLPVVRRGQPKPRPVADEKWLAAREAADFRVRLMIDLGAQLGLRRAEIAAVHRDDVVPVRNGWALVVHGKGRRERILPIDASMAQRLRRATGWVFPGRNPDSHLTPDRVGRLLRMASGGEWCTHQLRHRFASTVYNATGDLLSTQQLLGHSKPETTQGYVQVTDDRLRLAAATAAA